MKKLNNLKSPEHVDGEGGEREHTNKSLKRLRSVVAMQFAIIFFSVGAAFVLAMTVARIAEPKLETYISYINDDGVMVTEKAATSIPTIWQTERFVSGCLKRIYQLDAASYEIDLDEASYCFSSIGFKEIKRDLVANVVDPIFLRNKRRGNLDYENLSVNFLYDSRTAPSSSNCSPNHINQFERILDCRTFEVTLDLVANFYEDGLEGRYKKKQQIEVFILPRKYSINGMYIFFIGDKN